MALNFSTNQDAELQLGAPSYVATAFGDADMSSGMYEPIGVSVDSSDSVYVSDTGGHRVMRWGTTPATDGAAMSNVLMKQSASQWSWFSSCSNGANRPEQMTSFGAGGLAVADRYNHRIAIFPSELTADGGTATVFLGQANSSSCQPNRSTSTPAANTLSAPASVWTDGTKVAVADTQNNRILLWDAFPTTGASAARVLGQANFTSRSINRGGALNLSGVDNPKGVWFDGTRLYVADSGNHRVLVWNSWPASGAAADYVIGQANGSSVNTSCSNNRLEYPAAVTTATIGGVHRILISVEYQNRVVVLDAWPTTPTNSPTFSSVIGQPDLTSCRRNQALASATAATLNRPAGMSVDSAGKVWVVDAMNDRVLRYPSLASGVSADRVLGQTDFTGNTSVNGDDKNVFLLATGNTQATDDGTRVAMSTTGTLVAPDPRESSVRIWSAAPTVQNQAYALRYGQTARDRADGNGPGNTLSASSVDEPHGAWTDGTRLLVADTSSNRVLVWMSMPTSDTDAPDYVLGQANFTSKSTATTQAGLSKPVDVASDGVDVFVADRDNNRVLVYRNFWITPSNGKAASVVFGQPNFTSGGATTSQSGLDEPWSISVDSRNRLVVADRGNDRVLVWNNHATAINGQNANAVIGQPDFTTEGSGTIGEDSNGVQLAGGGVIWSQDCAVYYLDPLPTSGAVMTASGEIGTGCQRMTASQRNIDSPSDVTAGGGHVWVANAGHARLMRWVDATTPTITAAPTATVRCDGTVTVTWTTSESTTTEIRWDTVSRASWAGGYANQNIDSSYTGLTHSYDLSFPTPGTKYVRVRAEDWNTQAVISSEISFTVPATCPAPTSMLGDDTNAQAGTGRPNPSATSAPAINSTAFHTSWRNVAGVTMDRQETQTWSTPPEHAGGVWHLDSSTAADVNAQTSNPVSWTGGQPYTTGRFGTAATFTANTQYGTIANNTAITKTNDFTFDLWFNTTSISNSAYPIMAAKSDGGCGVSNNCNYSLEFDRSNNRLCAVFVNTNSNEIQACSTAVGLVDGTWHHAAMTVSSTNQVRLYVDGALTAGPTASAYAPKTTTGPLSIARSADNFDHYRGSIDEIRFSPVRYDDAAIRGYYRTRRPHLDDMGSSTSTVLDTSCDTATRCEDRTYTGQSHILRLGARYWQRTRYNTVNNDYWTTPAVDWLETRSTPDLTISTSSANVDLGMALAGQNRFGTTVAEVTTNSGGGYQLLGSDESDDWGLERSDGLASVPDRQDSTTPPAPWALNTTGFVGLTVLSATGDRLAKWGPVAGGFPPNDTTNNLYTALELTSNVVLHERLPFDGPGTTDSIEILWRVNPDSGQAPGAYTGAMTLTAIAIP